MRTTARCLLLSTLLAAACGGAPQPGEHFDVIVLGVPVLADGEHTGATPGRVVRGPGWTG